jgi:hypothetical protein
MVRIFNECQRSSSSHRRSVLALSKMYTADPEAVLDAFMACVHHLLIVYKREPAVERAVAFVATACSPSTDEATENNEEGDTSSPTTTPTGAAAAGLGDKFAVDVIRYVSPHT